jgi:Trk-type K+ transport system membrane component
MLKKLKKWLFGTYIRGFVVSYFLFLMAGATMLKLPMSIQAGASLSWLDAIFVSVSGMSTTGLSTIVVKDVLTTFGQTVLAFILQFGGIGLIMFISSFWLITRRKIGFRERNMIMTDQNQIGRAGIVGFIRNVLIMIFTIEIIGFLLMVTILYVNHSDVFAFKEILFQSFFLTISMFTNAGFDISPNADSLFMYKNDYAFQSLAMGLMVLGAIGFWPLAEFKMWIEAKLKKKKYRFSLFSKILISMHLGLWLISAVIVFVVEFKNPTFLADPNIGFFQGFYHIMFMSLTTRNAGFATMSMNDMTGATQVFFAVLMFIGSSPNSAGGGIRTTTFLVVILGLSSYAKGKDQVVISKKSIKQDTVYKSLFVLIGAGALIICSLFILSISEAVNGFTLREMFFEIASAFGTTGLSLGITSSLTAVGKIVLIVVMFIGRIGVLALLTMFKGNKGPSNVKYPEIDMIVG